MSSQPKGMRATANYFWVTNDVLGQGATGIVFKGREKKTGQEYAIKVFAYKTLSMDIRKREFDMLRKVNHNNIVRLFAIEEELATKQEVIIMELCDAGSLHTMLEDPENVYGFEEDEFKRVLSQVTSGMKYLHENGIVHRDLKPGNIMRSISQDGLSVFKLTDFGAARELNDNEQFVSLYGTEEYLHPDIYERAVLHKDAGKRFSATVDLWSIGATFYHVATGLLPFRPYGGVRRNKDVMFKMTKDKPPGVISGVQNSEHGDIEWSKDFPKTCRLSQGFKKIFAPVLSGVLESNPHRMWTFERYFKEVEDILNKTVINVFSVPSAMLHKVYISPEKTLAVFQEQIAALTDIRSSNQLLIFEGDVLKVEKFMPVAQYPKTEDTCPIMIMTTDVSDFQNIPIPHTCKPPKVKSALTLDHDANLARVCSSTLFDIEKSVKYLQLITFLIQLNSTWFVSYFKNYSLKIDLLMNKLLTKLSSLESVLQVFEDHYQRETSLLQIMSMVTSLPSEANNLQIYLGKITTSKKMLNDFRAHYEKNAADLKSVHMSASVGHALNNNNHYSTERLKEQMRIHAEKSRMIYNLFRKHKQMKRLTHSDDQLHKFEKLRLTEICSKSVSLFTEKSVPTCKQLHKNASVWLKGICNHVDTLNKVELSVTDLTERCCEFEEKLRKIRRGYRDNLSTVESILKEIALSPLNKQSGGFRNLSLLQNKCMSSINANEENQLDVLRNCLEEAKSNVASAQTAIESNYELLKQHNFIP